MKKVELEVEIVNIEANVKICKEDVTMHFRKMPNWKAPGLDGIQRFWFLTFTCQHHRLTEALNKNIQPLLIPSWLVKRRIVLIQKDPGKDNAAGNYWPTNSMLNFLRKFQRGVFADKLYQYQ